MEDPRKTERIRRGRGRGRLLWVINKSLISRVFSPPILSSYSLLPLSNVQAGKSTRTSALRRRHTHLQTPAGLISSYLLGLGGDWYAAALPGLSDIVTALILSQGKVSVEGPAHIRIRRSASCRSWHMPKEPDKAPCMCTYRQRGCELASTETAV